MFWNIKVKKKETDSYSEAKTIVTIEEKKLVDEEELEVVPSINKFATRFMTLINYMSKHRDIETLPNEHHEKLFDFLSWKSMEVNRYNFEFLYSFASAVIFLSKIYPVKLDSWFSRYDDTTKSYIVKLNILSRGITLDFDFYKIPNRLESYLDGFDNPSKLEEYIYNTAQYPQDGYYLNIVYKERNSNYERNITVPLTEGELVCEDNDRFLLESILNYTYEYCESAYEYYLTKLMVRYYWRTFPNYKNFWDKKGPKTL